MRKKTANLGAKIALWAAVLLFPFVLFAQSESPRDVPPGDDVGNNERPRSSLCTVDPTSEEGQKIDEREKAALQAMRPGHSCLPANATKVSESIQLQDGLLKSFQITQRELCNFKSLREKQFKRATEELTGGPAAGSTDNCDWFRAQENLDKGAREMLKDYLARVEERGKQLEEWRKKAYEANQRLINDFHPTNVPNACNVSASGNTEPAQALRLKLAAEVQKIYDDKDKKEGFLPMVKDLNSEVTLTKGQMEGLEARAAELKAERDRCSAAGCLADERSNQRPNFSAMDDQTRRREFVKWMTPYALEVQQNTGLPASVVIAQASVETDWGSSPLFRQTGNTFGHSCWTQGSTKTYSIPMSDGTTRTVTGTCDRPRPAAEGGYYLSFRDPQDSIYAYASNLLYDPGSQRYYSGIRNAVRNATPQQPANYQDVVNGLGSYAADPSYRQVVSDRIRTYNLDSLKGKKLCSAVPSV